MSMHFKTRLKPSIGLIDLTPLVDVIFLMLIFFVVTSDILPLKSLHLENPTLNMQSVALTTQLLVVMDAENVIYVGSKKDISDFESLKDTLEKEIHLVKASNPFSHDPTLVLSVDRHVDYGSFLKLFSIAQSCSRKIRLVYKQQDRSLSL